MKCLKCNEENISSAKFCKGCGEKFSNMQSRIALDKPQLVDEPDDTIRQSPQHNKHQCPDCNANNQPSARFCKNCGSKMDDSIYENQPETTPITPMSNKTKKKILEIAGIIIGGFAIIKFRTGFYASEALIYFGMLAFGGLLVYIASKIRVEE